MERYVIRGGTQGYERLKVLARVRWPSTSVLFERVGLAAPMDCVDIGCGGGDVTLELARRVSPGRVVGIDMDEVKLDLARREAEEQGCTNVEFRALNVYEWSEPDSYDVVYCRNVLQHLARPVDVLRSMWAAVRVGGVVAVEDADFEGSFCDPPSDAFAFWVDAYPRVLERHGGDPLSGRKLHRFFTEAGIGTPHLAVAQDVDVVGEAKTMPYLTIEATRDAILAEGIASAEEVDVALDGLDAFARDEGSLCGSPRIFQAWARRESAGAASP